MEWVCLHNGATLRFPFGSLDRDKIRVLPGYLTRCPDCGEKRP